MKRRLANAFRSFSIGFGKWVIYFEGNLKLNGGSVIYDSDKEKYACIYTIRLILIEFFIFLTRKDCRFVRCLDLEKRLKSLLLYVFVVDR